jgi:hypothetical protein
MRWKLLNSRIANNIFIKIETGQVESGVEDPVTLAFTCLPRD